jgi:hypothetical protein
MSSLIVSMRAWEEVTTRVSPTKSLFIVCGGSGRAVVVDGCRCRQRKTSPHSIVPWNDSPRAMLASMRKIDRWLGGVILAGLAAAALIGFIFGLH